MIEIKNISKSYGDQKIIENFSANFETGFSYCIMGPSGIGKTTLMNIISGLLKKDGGEILGIGKMKKSFIFQENRLLPWFSVYENMKYVTEDENAIENALKSAGLCGDREKKPNELSGGMQRRLAIARAAAFGGDIFFIDEPIYGLDVKTGGGILDFIKETVRGKTAFIITHSPEDAFVLADKIIFLTSSPISEYSVIDKTEFHSAEEIKKRLVN